MLSFWVINEEGDHGSILADTLGQAERILFEGILADQYPIDAILVEQMPDGGSEIEVYEPLDDDDIISTEYLQ